MLCGGLNEKEIKEDEIYVNIAGSFWYSVETNTAL